MKQETTALIDVETIKVSLVDRGANKKKRFPFTKAENGNMKNFAEIMEAVIKTEADKESALMEFCTINKISNKGMDAVKAALRLLSAYKNEIPMSIFSKLSEMAGFEKPKDPMDDDEKKIKTQKTEVEPMIKMEDLPEAVRKQLAEFQNLKERTEKAEKALEVEKDARALTAWETKVEKELQFYPGKDLKEIAKELFELEKLSVDLAKSQFEEKKTISETMEKSEILKSKGFINRRGDDLTIDEKVAKKADELIAKFEGMTKEQAIAKVWEDNPELYKAYANENPRQYGE